MLTFTFPAQGLPPSTSSHNRLSHSVLDPQVLKEDEGGRKKPFFSNYRPQAAMLSQPAGGTVSPLGFQAFIRTGMVTVEVQLPETVGMACLASLQTAFLGHANDGDGNARSRWPCRVTPSPSASCRITFRRRPVAVKSMMMHASRVKAWQQKSRWR